MEKRYNDKEFKKLLTSKQIKLIKDALSVRWTFKKAA